MKTTRLKKRFFPVRFWRSYRVWRRLLPVIPALRYAWMVSRS